jgi:hypothetical protein
LDEVSLQTFGEKQTGIPNRFCKVFDLHDDEKIQAYLTKLSNKTCSNFGLSYQTVLNNQITLSILGLLDHAYLYLKTYQQSAELLIALAEAGMTKKLHIFSMRVTTLDIDKKKFS